MSPSYDSNDTSSVGTRTWWRQWSDGSLMRSEMAAVLVLLSSGSVVMILRIKYKGILGTLLTDDFSQTQCMSTWLWSFLGAKITTRNSWRVNLISQSLNFIYCSKVLFSNHFSSDDTSHTRRFFPLTEIDATSRSSILCFSLTSVIYHHTHVSIGIRIILSTALLIFWIKANFQTIFGGQTGWSEDWRKVSECDVRF